ncbi:MAG: hypothetical protein DRQ88_03410 [Epsilonproteobacteria bacterium]|nr:MAG: hypothetical protein DRQ89_01350 [Campylobacterota bacterium]RLA67367.1 MAG: hypothetical protein DRQ88_03410 [Campylobacterota bacterium]
MELNKKAINPPTIKFGQAALSQIKLILENDFTLTNQYFRVQITGKECDGFTYSTGFTTIHDDDLTVLVEDVKVIIDPFSAYYLKNTKIDYIQDFANEEEGFVVINHDQEDFTGKFWREAPEKIPPLIDDKNSP